ncbi:MAG: tyrosine-type recombinase/integrase [Thermoplasmata archaeon]
MVNRKSKKKLENEKMRRRFLKYGTNTKEWKPSTMRLYDRAVSKLFSHADKQWDKVTSDDVDAFQHWLKDGDKDQDQKALAPKSRGIYVAGVKAFYTWTTRKGHKDMSKLLQQIEPVRKMHPKPYQYLSEEEGQEIIKALDNIRQPLHWNTRIVICLGMVGLRDGEILGLKIENIDPKLQSISIKPIDEDPNRGPKNDKPRVIFPNLYKSIFGFDVFQEIEAYLETHPYDKKSEYLVRNLNGRPIAHKTNAGRLHRLAGNTIGRPVKFHSLRHWAATVLAWHGIDLNRIKDHLGHNSTVITAGYIHTDEWMAARGMDSQDHPGSPDKLQGVAGESSPVQNGNLTEELILRVADGKLTEDRALDLVRLHRKLNKELNGE